MEREMYREREREGSGGEGERESGGICRGGGDR